MNKSLYFIFTAAAFSMLVCAPGRFAYGFVLMLEFLLIISGASAFSYLVKTLKLENLKSVLNLAFIMFLTIAFKLVLVLVSPVMALTLSFVIYVPAISAFMLSSVLTNEEKTVKDGVAKNLVTSLVFALFTLVFFFVRDVAGFGTITLPAKYGITEKVLFDVHKSAFFSFFASVPGALMMVAVTVAVIILLQNKFSIIEKAGTQNDSE